MYIYSYDFVSLHHSNYRGHRGYLMFAAMKSIQVVARVTKEYMHEVDPYRDKVKEYVEKLRKQEWLDWMAHSVSEYRQNGWAVGYRLDCFSSPQHCKLIDFNWYSVPFTLFPT